MVLTEDNNDARYQIKSIASGKIKINDETYTNSVIITPNTLTLNWPPHSADQITDADLLLLLETQPEVILIGTGERSVILPAKKIAVLLEKQYHVECMNTAAACRTYTILAAEGRKVAAGLIL